MAMQSHGLLLDKEAQRETKAKLTTELKEVDEYIIQFAKSRDTNKAGYFAVLESNKQLAELLFDDLGLKCHKYTEGGDRSTDQDSLIRTLSKLRKRDQEHRQTLEFLFHRSKIKTILERYVNLEADDDGRVRPTIKFAGTKTGRLAYSDPAEQQRPVSVRNLYRANAGCVFIGADYSQLEARIMAYLAGDLHSQRVFESGDDIHAANARDLFDYRLSEWESLSPEERTATRDYAKTDLYRRMYGGSYKSGKQKLFCPCHKCQGRSIKGQRNADQLRLADARWNMKHIDFIRWRKKLERQVMDSGWYENPYGRRRQFMAPFREIVKELYDVPMQSTAADIMNESQTILYNQHGITCCLQMHDFLMIEVPEENAPWALKVLADVMERPIEKMDGVRFPVDKKMGVNWRDMNPVLEV